VIVDILDSEEVCKKVIKALDSGASPENAARIAFDSLEKPETLKIELSDHIKVAEALKVNTLSSTTASMVLETMSKDPDQDVQALISSQAQVSDQGEIEKIVRQVLDENPQAAADVKNGETKAVGFLTGQVMAKSQGKANPKLAQETIKQLLGL
jgi:aspartyl-tRNA(Asn)/glutamyl-tRNA(Gln) amidotransferase subunit B